MLAHTADTLLVVVTRSSAGADGREPSVFLHVVPSMCLGSFTAQWLIPRASITRERGRQKPYVFNDLASEVSQHHFCCSLLIKAIRKARPVQGERDSGKVLEVHIG